MKRVWARFLETRYFGLVLGLLVFGLVCALSFGTVIIKNLEQKVLDFNFRVKNTFDRSRLQEGVVQVNQNPKVSPDILILGIDDKALTRFGKWPFPRYRHADLIDAFSRIKYQSERERALFLDLFFVEPDKDAGNDVRLVQSIKDSGRVYLETILQYQEYSAGTEEDLTAREDLLYARFGRIEAANVAGDWLKISDFKSVLSPLAPYTQAAAGYGNATFVEDEDQVYRKQPLVARLSRLVKEIPLNELTVNEPVDRAAFEHLSWVDKENHNHEVPYPLTDAVIGRLEEDMEKMAPLQAEDTNEDGTPEKTYYVVRKYREELVPAIPLALALDYFNRKITDIRVVLGKDILIPSPQKFNVETQSWEPYVRTVTPPKYDNDGNEVKPGVYKEVPEIRIPIDEHGEMLINFMGRSSSANPDEYQTFPIRSFSGYAGTPAPEDPQKWPQTKRVENKILMVGIFAQGLAEDQKPTPFGLMYGVEIHATALNTILMQVFLRYADAWVTVLILFGVVMITSFMVSRLSTLWSLVFSLVSILAYFMVVLLVFDLRDYVLSLSSPVLGIFLSFLAVVAYRTMTEERDKARIRTMFGKYVSPSVVDQILENPPELGGVDKDLTVFFSDIRGFTTLSETMTPQELVNHLNAYLTAMTDIILDYQGTLDKYVGDAIMSFWGAPLPQPDHALLACKCALKQLEVLEQLNSMWPPEKRLSIGIGLNSGIMTVGNMGSLGRMNYTLTGDAVNLGARLEGTNKSYSTTIIMSEYTHELVKDKVIARELDNIRVKGKNKPVLIYELLDVTEGLIPPKPLPLKGKR